MLRRLADVLEDAENELPTEGRALLRNLGEELRRLDERVKAFDAELAATARRLEACQRLMAIPGIGLQTSTALVARWETLRSSATAGRWRCGSVWCRGSARPAGGRRSWHQQARRQLPANAPDPRGPFFPTLRVEMDGRSRWALATEQRRGRNIAAVALANKNARTAWAVLAPGVAFDIEHVGRAA